MTTGVFHGRFAGERDRARLSTQLERIRAWALARDWFTVRQCRESLEQLYAPTLFPENSIATQMRNLEKSSAGTLRCRKEKRRRPGGLWEYRLHAIPCAAAMDATLTAPLAKIRWPARFAELEAAGYGYTGTGKECSCGRAILWFITPRRKWIPLSTTKDDRLVPHRVVCANVAQLRSTNAQHQARASPDAQASLFPQ